MADTFDIPAHLDTGSCYLGKIDDKGDLRPPAGSPPVPNLNLLVSLCNVWPYGFTLALYNTRSHFFDFIGVAPDRSDFVGADSISRLNGGRYVVADQRGWGGKGGYTLFGADLSIQACVDLGEDLDLHDAVPYRGGFALSLTASDQVVWKRDGKPDKVLYTTGSGADTVHVNGLTVHAGHIYASMFGPKTGDSWREAAGGQIIDCVSGEVVASGLYQPHTPVATADGLWVCESGHSNVLFFDKAGTRHKVAGLRGYLRGLAVTPRYLVVGASAVRRKSRHLGVNVDIKVNDLHIEASRLYVIDRRTGDVWARDIPHIGHEIFSVSLYTGARRPSLASTLAAMQQRVYAASLRA